MKISRKMTNMRYVFVPQEDNSEFFNLVFTDLSDKDAVVFEVVTKEHAEQIIRDLALLIDCKVSLESI